MNKSKAEKIVAQLLAIAAELRYGTVAVAVKIHAGRVVEVTHTKTEHTRDSDDRCGKQGE